MLKQHHSLSVTYALCHTNPVSSLLTLQSMSPATSKENKDKTQKKKKSSRTVWTVPTEKLWTRGCSTPTLPLYNPPPSTPVKGTSISKLKEMNGWKWSEKHYCQVYRRRTSSWGTGRDSCQLGVGKLENHQIAVSQMLINLYVAGNLIYFTGKPTIMQMLLST